MVSTTTGPRSEPTWTVPDGVFESLTTCGPETDAASSSAQNTGLPDADERVLDRPLWGVHGELVALLEAHQGRADRRLIADAPFARGSLGGADDRERLLAVAAPDDHLRADADLVAVRLLDHLGVAQLKLQGRDP